MSAFLALPPELRELILGFLPPTIDHISYGSIIHSREVSLSATRSPYNSLLCTCRQLRAETATHQYRNIHLDVEHPVELLRWITHIGPYNSSCIHQLVLSTKSLAVKAEESSWAYESGWALALRSMPKLQALTLHFSQEPAGKLATDRHQPNANPYPDLLQALSVSAFECSTITPKVYTRSNPAQCLFQPNLRRRAFTHAFFSFHEPLPPVLVQYFNTTARYCQEAHPYTMQSYAHHLLDKQSMEKNVTGLPSSFFEQNGFHLSRTHAFNENNENANALLTFTRPPQSQDPPFEHLRNMMRDLPQLGYLRIGCRDLDSTFLIHVPRHLHTLDVAFTDNDPGRVADNLMTMRGICRNLFTLAIAVSPLHDREPADKDERKEVFFNRESLGVGMKERWAPLWKALDEIKGSKVKIWEGEGPGFRRGKGNEASLS